MGTNHLKHQGFTLIAILVATVVVAIIAGIIFYNSTKDTKNIIETKKNAVEEIEKVEKQVNKINQQIEKQINETSLDEYNE